MELKIIEVGNSKVAQLNKDVMINELQDAVDLLGNANYLGAEHIILEEKNLTPLFFDLKTGIAGEILQKYSNYRMQLAIIGEFEKYESNALKAFIIECNRSGPIFFVPDFDTAVKKLT